MMYKEEIESLFRKSPYFPDWHYEERPYDPRGYEILVIFSAIIRYKYRTKWYVVHCLRTHVVTPSESKDYKTTLLASFIQTVYPVITIWKHDKTRCRLDVLQISETERLFPEFNK